jgi:flagellar protein FliL
MAEENEEIKEPSEGTGKKGMPKWIVIVVVVLLLGIGGFIGWQVYAKANSGEPAAKQVASEDAQPTTGVVFPLRSFIVNLMEKAGIGKKYLKVTMAIEVENDEDKKTIEKFTPQISDMILLLLSSQSTREINTLEGKLELKQALLSRMNQVLGRAIVRKVYFTEFVVQ